MKRILLTAFEPYAHYRQNASWLALVELTKDLPTFPEVTTRLYPVDYGGMQSRLRNDLEQEFDFAIHLGQAPGSPQVNLEAVAINVAHDGDSPAQQIVDDGPTALQTALPVERLMHRLRQAELPAAVSYHAGTYLCNAVYYLSMFFSQQLKLPTRSLFVHVPLVTAQVLEEPQPVASLPVETIAKSIGLLIESIARMEEEQDQLA